MIGCRSSEPWPLVDKSTWVLPDQVLPALGTWGRPARVRPSVPDMDWTEAEAEAGRGWHGPVSFRQSWGRRRLDLSSWGCKQLDDIQLVRLSFAPVPLPCVSQLYSYWFSFPLHGAHYSLGIHWTVNTLDSKVWENWRHKQQKLYCYRGPEEQLPFAWHHVRPDIQFGCWRHFIARHFQAVTQGDSLPWSEEDTGLCAGAQRLPGWRRALNPELSQSKM